MPLGADIIDATVEDQVISLSPYQRFWTLGSGK